MGDTVPVGDLVSAGFRSAHANGGSVKVALPKKEIREGIGIDIEERIDGDSLQYRLFDDGTLLIKIL